MRAPPACLPSGSGIGACGVLASSTTASGPLAALCCRAGLCPCHIAGSARPAHPSTDPCPALPLVLAPGPAPPGALRRLQFQEHDRPHIAAIEGGRPGVGTEAASNHHLRFSSARRFQERRRPRYPGTLTLSPIQYRSEVEISGSSEIVVAGSCLQRRANSAGVVQSSDEWGRLSL